MSKSASIIFNSFTIFNFAFLSFSTSYAEADGPDYWKVNPVASVDQLKIHEEPEETSRIMGELPPDANCLKNLGCQGGITLEEFNRLDEHRQESTLKSRPRWCKIEFQDVLGWVAAGSLAEDGCVIAKKDRGKDPLNTTYLIENESVELINGQAEQRILDSSTVIQTFAWKNQGSPAQGDLNHDGHQDAALLLIQNPGGTGTFYYVAAALYLNNSYEGTNAVYLGDRILPIAIGTLENKIFVDYLNRKDTEPMSAEPSIETRKWFKIQENILIETGI